MLVHIVAKEYKVLCDSAESCHTGRKAGALLCKLVIIRTPAEPGVPKGIPQGRVERKGDKMGWVDSVQMGAGSAMSTCMEFQHPSEPDLPTKNNMDFHQCITSPLT